ncbi:MAG: VPLPA-CTERM sorting domain-containing protein [Nitrospira sp.]|nr:VPLPA-CTERM sorting domain-containing protein [Nitrospira sp.]
MTRSIFGNGNPIVAGKSCLRRVLSGWVLGLGALLLCNLQPAFAHVAFTNAGTFDGTEINFSNTLTQYKAHGWVDGADADLGDSHQIGGTSARWFKFTLNQPGLVDISLIQNSAGLDPAFTLYKGAFLAGSHDDSGIDPKNPVDPITFQPIPSPTDADPSGQYLKHSGYRDTVNNTYEGQFDAFGSWSMGNAADLHSSVEYVLAQSGTSDFDPSRGLTWGGNGNHDTAVGTGESLLQYYLPAGTYSVAAGGEACNDGTAACQSPFRSATFSLNVQPVPLPAAFWLMGSALGSLGLLGWRGKRAGC